MSEPFVVEENGWTDVPPIRLLRWAWLEVTGIEDARGRSPQGDVRITLQPEGGVERTIYLSGRPILVSPGAVTLRARLVAGPDAYEETLQIPEGETVGVRIWMR